MVSKKHYTSRIYEKMKMLKALIGGAKVSHKKLLELQIEYCYLQREYELTKKR